MAAEGKKWLRIKAEYLRGGISYRALAERHNVSFSQLTRVARKEKWFELKKQTEEKARTQIMEDAAEMIAKRQTRISNVADRVLDAIEDILREGISDGGTRALREIAATLKDIKDIQNVRSRIDLDEQEARIAKLRKDAERGDQIDREIRIVMDPALQELAK